MVPGGRALAVGAALAAAMLVASSATASAAVDPYASGTNGYDTSYLDCSSAAPAGAFGIVGVNAGYPFTYYSGCLASEYAAAAKTGNAALYLNTGYDPTYTAIDGRHTTQECASASVAIAATPSQQAAWAVGCSEAQRDLAYAASQSATSPSAWWLDVETANSWSTGDLSLNRFTIQGLVETLRGSTPAPIGVYSTPAQWTSITGGYQAAVDADWVAIGRSTAKRAKAHCGATGFTGAPTWLVQYVAAYDHDYAC